MLFNLLSVDDEWEHEILYQLTLNTIEGLETKNKTNIAICE